MDALKLWFASRHRLSVRFSNFKYPVDKMQMQNTKSLVSDVKYLNYAHIRHTHTLATLKMTF